MSEFPRKNIRLHPDQYIGKRQYFVTLCFDRRRRFGANPRIARWLVCQLQDYSASYAFRIEAYCVMPDHVHLLAQGAQHNSDLLKFIEMFKQQTAHDFNAKTNRRLWQFKYFDHILRKASAAEDVSWYIWMNPVRKGICKAPHEYEFSGSFTEYGSELFRKSARIQWVPPWRKPPTNPGQCSAALLGQHPRQAT